MPLEQCISWNAEDRYMYISTLSNSDCIANKFTALTYDEYSEYVELKNASHEVLPPFVIDSQVYSVTSGYLLLSFVSGHILGRIVKTMGKK